MSKGETLSVYNAVVVEEVQAGYEKAQNNCRIKLRYQNGSDISTQFLLDGNGGQSQIDHVYATLLAALVNNYPITVATTGYINSDGYGYINSCTVSTS